ncbi:MAG: folate-binding protein [Pseudomonadota bacterium]
MSSNPTSPLFTRLSSLGVIHCQGEEAGAFLQGQFGNDLSQVDDAHHQLNSYATPKGRVLTVFRVHKHRDEYLLTMPKELVAPTLQRLRMFVLRAKVVLNDASDQVHAIGLWGDGADEVLSQHIEDMPMAPGDTRSSPEFEVSRLPGDTPRFLIHIHPGHDSTTVDSIVANCTEADDDQWALSEIHAGIPQVFVPTQEEFVPQMLNLQLVDGLSFKKGCYPGQEIVARMHYLGKLKRRMYRFSATDTACPSPGSDVMSADDGSALGKVVDARMENTNAIEGLAVLQIDKAESHGLTLTSDTNASLTLHPLPYPFETNNEK